MGASIGFSFICPNDGKNMMAHKAAAIWSQDESEIMS
jgi:hypothetical protein